MRRSPILLALLLGACGPTQWYLTPTSGDPKFTTYPHEMSYELLGIAKGDACDWTENLNGGGTRDPRSIGGGYLFEKAKYIAISSVEGADNLMMVRSTLSVDHNKQCVTVTGRAYRVTWMRAVRACGEPAKVPSEKATIMPVGGDGDEK